MLLEAMLDRGIRPASASNLVRIPSNFVHGVASVEVSVDVPVGGPPASVRA